MNLQTITSTNVQRNFSKIMDMEDPVIVVRDSRPEKVIVGYEEYLRTQKVLDDRLDRELEEMLDKVHSRNRNIDEKKLDKLMREAMHAAGRD